MTPTAVRTLCPPPSVECPQTAALPFLFMASHNPTGTPPFFQSHLTSNRFGGALRMGPGPFGVDPPPIKVLNLSGNWFNGAVGLSGFSGLQVLDLFQNDISVVPMGLEDLKGLKHLDVSHNSMAGSFPKDFPPLTSPRSPPPPSAPARNTATGAPCLYGKWLSVHPIDRHETR